MKLLLFIFTAGIFFLPGIAEEMPGPRTATKLPSAEPLQFNYQPININGAIMIALNDLTKHLPITLSTAQEWIILDYKGMQAAFKIDSDEAKVNNEIIKLPFRTFSISDFRNLKQTKETITFVPLSFIMDALRIPFKILKKKLFIDHKIWQFSDKKIIAVDLNAQMAYAFEGQVLAREFRICSGKTSTPTPTGIFEIYRKRPGWHSWLATKAVPYCGSMYNSLYFYEGTAFHGSEEMKETPSSHGCCRMFCQDAFWLYHWTPPSSPDNKNYVPKIKRIAVCIF